MQNNTSVSPSPLGCPPLDRMLALSTEGPHQPRRPPPVIELTSVHTGAGATHLIYRLAAANVLAKECGGHERCVVLVDTDGHFDVEKLADQLKVRLQSGPCPQDSDSLDGMVFQSLRHLHIFRPQSLAALTSCLRGLQSYLFNQQRHFSYDRAVGFIAIDSASAFCWQDRAETEDAAFYAKTSAEPGQLPPSAYNALAASLKEASAAIHCPVIFTSRHSGPVQATPHAGRALRPSLPPPFPTLPTLRLVCQRLQVKKFPPWISVKGALREAADRLKAVEQARFECVVNEWGIDERTLRKLQSAGGGFEFRITDEGVKMVDEGS